MERHGSGRPARPAPGGMTAEDILRTLDAHSNKLRELGAVRLGLFGSYVHGEQSPDSDLDFVVVLREKTFETYMDIKFYLEDLFGRKVDLVIESSIKPIIKERILSEARYAEGLETVSD